ncbi:MAG: poly-beta-1,6 N-acetyl-D-glucosamine export porin PgaA [Alphaproteobacteria bacterium]|nr:poly-beta-1,6 N-acetyl-D-glucosamine export porin PgaA [Alphaproteobacteria bacterium]
MIKCAKIQYARGIASVIILGGFMVAGPVAAAAQSSDTTVNPSAAAGNDGATGAFSGVAIGSAGIATPAATAVGTESPSATDDDTKAKSLEATAARILDAISKHPTGRGAARADWRIEQDKAVEAARAGNYDQALPVLDRLHQEHPQDLSIASDRAAILGWAGRDADAVAAYQALPPGDRPDYLIDAIGHSYRNLHQPADALAVYRLGLQKYPNNQSFLAGEIFSLLESGHLDEAVAHAQQEQAQYPNPDAPLLQAIKTALDANAVQMARNGDYTHALPAFAALHDKYPDDAAITGDYVVALSWAGRDADAVKLYAALPQNADVPDYVLDAAAHSYRNLHQSKKALALYQAALDKTPDNVTYAVGVIDCLSDLGRTAEALKVAKEQMAKHPEKPPALVKAYINAKRTQAIDLARHGHYNQALALLRQLRAEYPHDANEEMDYIAVLSWAGRDAQAVREYHKVAHGAVPDYVLEAVGHSYRTLGESEKAMLVYRRGLKQSPHSEVFAAGIIRCLDDLGRYAEGEKIAKKYIGSYGDHLEVLLAGGEAANFNDDAPQALDYYERANALSPHNKEGLRGLAHAEDRVGAPQLAIALADKHPGLMTGHEYRSFVGDADENLVRWGPLEPASEATRFVAVDKAIATLDDHIDQWTAKNDPSYFPDIMRARFDLLVALHDRSRMQAVVDQYNALVNQGVEVPAYALVAVGDAYLYLHQPEIARDVFLKVLQSDPQNVEARHLLAYAYLEAGQYDEAFATSDKLVADAPIWIYLKGEPERQPNPEREAAELEAAELRAYAGLMDQGDAGVTRLADAAPYDARNRAAEGGVDLMRGWPRAALEQYRIGLAIQRGHDVANETGIASANLDLQNYRETDAELQSLTQRFPENLGVQRTDREWDVHNMAEIDMHAGYNFAPTGSENGVNSPHGQGFTAGAELYSAPIDYNWRLFAGEDWSHEHEPAAEGIVDYSRVNAGIEYRNGDVTATAAPTYNRYVSSTTTGGANGNRIGVDGTFHYTFNDMWSAGIAAEIFSANTPLRALNAGVTADEYQGTIEWRQSESRSLTFTAGVMPFSDNNLRTTQEAEYIERLYTDPIWRLDAESDVGLSQDSKDENRLYYNPSMDLTGLAGLRLTQVLYHRYETTYQHSLLAMPGFYSQEHYGTSPAWTIRYEQSVLYNDTLNASAGVNYSHQDYDGSALDAVSLTMNVAERF